MRELPLRAQVFLLGVIALGVAAALNGGAITPDWGALPRSAWPKAWEFPLFVLFAAIGGRIKVPLIAGGRDANRGSMTLAFAITYAALLRCGPDRAMVVSLASCLPACLFPKRQRPVQIAFNVALTLAETWATGWVFLALNNWTPLIGPGIGETSVTAIALSAVVYFVVNTGAVATIIGLSSGENPWTVWVENFLWTSPGCLAGASAGAGASYLAANLAFVTPLLFVVPVGVFTNQTYRFWRQRNEEEQRREEEHRQRIEEQLASQQELAELYLATIKTLALAIDAKDQYTHEHILRVQRYALATAEEMGLQGGDLEAVKTGALLHDIGKMGVPEYVLLKPSGLSDEEYARIRKHPEIGAAILAPVPFKWPVVPAVRHHHERWDGKGYPDGLAGEDIPLTARILAVADSYDAMTSTRSYREGRTHETAQAVLRKDAGTQFDPVVVDAFLRVIDRVTMEMGASPGESAREEAAAALQHAGSSDTAVREIHRASSELWALYEVAQTLSAGLGVQETLDIIAGKLEAVYPGSGIVLMMQDSESGALQACSAVGINRAFFEGCRAASEDGCSTGAIRNRHTYVGDYDSLDLLLSAAPGSRWTPLHSALIVPLLHEASALGTVNLYHPAPDAFGDHDRQMLETIARRVAKALYNGMLFERTRSHALTDPLTGLYNIRHLGQVVEDRCEAALANVEARAGNGAGPERVRRHETFALLLLDLDSFKAINDNFGHQKGDAVLRDLGVVLRNTVREGDVVARYGGDEFLLVMDRATPQDAVEMAERVEYQIRSYDPGLVHPRVGPIRLGASIGWACFPADGTDFASLLSVADTAMYRTKTDRKLGQLVAGEPVDIGLAVPRADESVTGHAA